MFEEGQKVMIIDLDGYHKQPEMDLIVGNVVTVKTSHLRLGYVSVRTEQGFTWNFNAKALLPLPINSNKARKETDYGT